MPEEARLGLGMRRFLAIGFRLPGNSPCGLEAEACYERVPIETKPGGQFEGGGASGEC
jgi:hypothetical protein